MNFGTDVVSSTLDPTLTTGWGVRTGDWQWGHALQQEIMPRVSAEISYQRRWLINPSATDNRATAASDYDQFSVIIPTDPRLPDGGGGTLDGIYNITAAANARPTDNFVTLADRFGANTQYDEFDQPQRHRPSEVRPDDAGRLQLGRHEQQFVRSPGCVPETALHQPPTRGATSTRRCCA